MNPKETEFAAKLLATFKIEAEEHLKALYDGLITLENDSSKDKKQEAIETIFREAHSLKGAARAVNHELVEKICQSLENVLSEFKHDKVKASQILFNTVYETTDFIGKLIPLSDSSFEQFQEKELFNSLLKRLDLLSKGEVPTDERKAEKPFSSELPLSPYYVPEQIEKRIDFSKEEKPNKLENLEQSTPVKTNSSSAEAKDRHAETLKKSTIRVSTHKLDHLLQQAEEMLMIKLTSFQRENDLKNMQLQFKKWDKDWQRIQSMMRSLNLPHKNFEHQALNPAYLSKQLLEFFEHQREFFKSFSENLHHLLQNTSQDNRILGSMIDTLLDDAKKILMQPLSTLYEIFPRMVRDISHQLEKEITLHVEGGDIEVDRRILEEMKDPLIHLIRNSIDHGIETRVLRQEHQKPICGTISIVASQISGNCVEIQISDDGKGIDVEKVKQAAINQGTLSKIEADQLSFDAALQLIFQSGISTSPIISELSGRGLGMGIVAEKTEKLGGKISIKTTQGKGTTFSITLPLTLATFRGIHIKVEDQDFILPTQHVNRALRIHKQEIIRLENRETITLEGKTLAFVHLEDVLGIQRKQDTGSQAKYQFAVIVKASEMTIAIGVDGIVSEQEVFTKSLGKQLLRLKNITSATVLEGGKVIPILDPFDLVKSAIKISGSSKKLIATPEAPKKKKRTVLIAEDSVTARMLLKNILETAGYIVKTAVDGAEAFSILNSEQIDMLLSDVEMPRMDGFALAQKVRQTEKLKELPIIICTSKGSKEDKEHGIEVGANAYIDKSSFAQSNLLDIIKKLF